MKKIKVLQVNKLYPPVIGGIEKFVQQLSESLNSEVAIKVLVCQERGREKDEIIHGVNVHRCTTLGVFLSMPISFSFLKQFINESKKNDIVTIHMPFPLADLALLLSRYKGHVVLWWHSDIVRQKKLLFFLRPLLTRTIKRADTIVVATKGHIMYSEFIKNYEEKCVIIPFSVNPKTMSCADKYLKMKKSGFEKDKFCFLFVGRLVYYKGCDILLRAFAKANLSKATLTIVGDGPLKKELIELVKNLNLASKVLFKNKVTDAQLYEEYEKSDVLVLPSVEKSEAFGLVQIEAMAFAKPVINTRLNSGVPYVGIDGVTGLTVNPKDIDELCQAMIKLYDNPEYTRTLGKNARKHVLNNYDSKIITAKIVELYNNINGGKK